LVLLNKNAKEQPYAQWRIDAFDAATTHCLIEANIQIRGRNDESDIQQPHKEENKFCALCQQFVDAKVMK
jgi:hypothetical protein